MSTSWKHWEGIPRDTSAAVYHIQCEIFRRIGAEKRAAGMVDLIEFINGVAASGVRRRHPKYTDEQVHLAVIRMRLGDQLFHKVYPKAEVRL
ncbi:MAG TPA: hypothetical protein VGI75_04190 [Pirellulales bacterium]|jgi:hypothetical protein